ncbi:MAG: hypothetical protein M3Z03_17200, partial [Actinomycetota bacterium]|nr:hypothetical protein [Actinomycetota bacterium]
AGVVAAAALIAGVTDVVADHHAKRAADALARGDGGDAAEAAEAAVDTRGDVLRLHLLAAEAVLLDQQGTVAALRHVDRALDLSPGDPIALRTKARLLVDRAGSTGLPAHRDEAASFVDERLRADPYEPQLWQLRATLALLEADPAAARAAAERAVELTPTSGS